VGIFIIVTQNLNVIGQNELIKEGMKI